MGMQVGGALAFTVLGSQRSGCRRQFCQPLGKVADPVRQRHLLCQQKLQGEPEKQAAQRTFHMPPRIVQPAQVPRRS